MTLRLGHRIAALGWRRPSWRQVLLAGPELAFLAALVAGLEYVGRHSPHDGMDLLALCALMLTGVLLVRAAEQGWLPVTAGLRRAVEAQGRRVIQVLEPRFALAMRPAPGIPARQDRALAAVAPWATALALIVVLLGTRVLDGLAWLRHSLSTTLYLLLLGALWTAFLAVISGASVLVARSFQAALGGRLGRLRSTAVLVGAWFLGVFALGCLPGIVPVVALALLGLGTARELARLPEEPYRLCRRAADGSWRILPLRTYVARLHRGGLAVLLLIAALGQASRLWTLRWPTAPFGMTAWLGLVASGSCLVLAGRLGTWMLRIAGARGEAPERPLVPTLWSLEGGETPEPAWLGGARRHGWLVLRGLGRPTTGFDLVAGLPGHAAAVPAGLEDLPEAELAFRLERRFHVVQRRQFFRAFERLFKELRPSRRPPGTGFLFGPHLRFLGGVLRDAEPPRRRAQFAAPPIHGTPYARLFPPRVRRYVGGVLRDLDVDIVFFEDAVAWKDLRRVFGVVFECYDQRRTPLDVRHFRGLPHVRVLLQAERADPDMEGEASALRTEDPPPGLARTLVILRDRGEGDVREEVEPPSTSRRTPSGMGVR